MLNQNKIVIYIHSTPTLPCEKSKMVIFGFSIMKSIAAPSFRSRFPVTLIYCNAIKSASSACCLLNSIAVNL